MRWLGHLEFGFSSVRPSQPVLGRSKAHFRLRAIGTNFSYAVVFSAWYIHSGYRLWNFLIAFFTPFIASAIDFRYGFVFAGKLCNSYLLSHGNGILPMSFAACNLTGAVVVYFFLYESADLSLESVDNVSSQYRGRTQLLTSGTQSDV